MSELTSTLLGEERFRVLFENSPEVLAIFDMDTGKMIEGNTNALKFFKVSKEELQNLGPNELSPAIVNGKPALEQIQSYLSEAMQGGNPLFDWVHLDSTGTEIPCEVRLVRFPPYDRNLVRASIIDKSEHRASQESLRVSEERLKLAIEASDLGTFDWKVGTDEVIWNDRMHEMCGLSKRSKINKNEYFFSIVHPEDKEKTAHNFARNLDPTNQDRIFVDEFRVVVKSEVKIISSRGMRITDPSGQAVRFTGTFQDVTATRKTEEQLKLQAEMLNEISEAIIGTDDNSLVTSWNQGAERIYGLSAEKAVGMSFSDITTVQVLAGDEDLIKKALMQDGVWRGESIQKNQKGEELYIRSSITALKNEHNELIGSISINQDITVIKQAEIAMHETQSHFTSLLENASGFALYRAYADLSMDNLAVVDLVSPSLAEVMGVEDPQDFNSWFANIHPEDLPRV
ncbi:MAG: PAS domain S-box protein, partial [Flavobacteriales bacterium]|nr:PAS domain S-box protein [Flavobacteriales bacterium]